MEGVITIILINGMFVVIAIALIAAYIVADSTEEYIEEKEKDGFKTL